MVCFFIYTMFAILRAASSIISYERKVTQMVANGEKRSGNSIFWAVFVGISLLLQVGWLLVTILELNRYSTAISLLSSIVASMVVLRLYSKNTNNAFKMPWIMLIMALPVMGLSLYLMVEASGSTKRIKGKMASIRARLRGALQQQTQVIDELQEKSPAVSNQCNYLRNHAHSPVYRNTRTDYYGEAKDALEAMKIELEKAESFIFMEYFIVEDAQSFEPILDVLVRKAAQGVEVRLMYDDIGSVGYVNLKFARRMNQLGIRCQAFNPAVPILNFFMNHRDHRKITVIDGKVAFTGGFNLANEYFGLTEPFGKWKDTGLRLEGEAVRSLIATFLELWSISARTQEDVSRYLDVHHSVDAEGFVQPFGDDPLTEERCAENVLLNMLGRAERYIYFITPYLIITDEMSRALGLAAKRGVDVRIITPGIPDKKTVYAVTRSYYSGLARQGVRIFEYSPGFCHAKQCVCDDESAMIGTSNLDYRSLYLHFENDVFLYDCPAAVAMAEDFRQMFPQCREMTEACRSGRSGIGRMWQCILRLFAPLL